MNSPRHPLSVLLLGGLLLLILNASAHAGSATWNLNPTNGNWNTAANWTPAVVPNGPTDIASFEVSNTTAVAVSRDTEVNGIVFNSDANAYTITPNPGLTLIISGAGITNSSTMAQGFVADADAVGNSSVILFSGSANAGSATTFATNGSPVAGKKGGRIQFSDDSSSGNGIFTNGGGVDLEMTPGMTLFGGNSTADHSSFTNEGATVASAYGGITQFQDTASAGNGNFTNKGSNSIGGSTLFFGRSTAQDATFTNTGGGLEFSGASTADHAFIVNEGGTTSNAFGGSTSFTDDSGAGEATIIARGASGTGIRGFVGFESGARAENATLIATGGKNGGAGGEIFFAKFPSPSTARVELFGNGSLNFLTSMLTIGSLEGNGLVDGDSGMARLTIGTNNLSTFFEGTISGVVYLDKVGTGTLTFGKATNYTQVTTILDGALLVTHHHNSATGYGPVYVNGGMLGGSGKIGGTVTVGTGQGLGATLSVGLSRSKPGLLTIQSQLTLQSDATCAIVVGNGKMTADRIVARGVTIASGALLSLVDLDGIVLDPGISLKVIGNTATTPIAGTFSNLPDGATVTAGSNTFQASYEGGDGNDLTLTVVP